MFKRIVLLGLFCLGLAVNAFCVPELKVNKRRVEEGQMISIFRKDLDAGKVKFALSGDKISKVEISLDRGRNWEVMEEQAGEFVFLYRPTSDERVRAEFLVTNEDGSFKTYNPDVVINYLRDNPEDALRQLLDKMRTFYEQERKDRFLSFFSSGYPDRVKFEEAIQNDFHNYNNIRLRFRIDRRAFDSDYTGGIWDVFWERNYKDRSGLSYSASATVGMRFDKEGDKWLVSGLKNNTIFGSSLIANPDLTVSSSGITVVVSPDDDVTAVIRNTGNANAGSFRVKFDIDDGTRSETGYENVSALTTGNQVSLTHTFSFLPDVPYTVTVTVDSANVISESSENNNQANQTFN